MFLLLLATGRAQCWPWMPFSWGYCCFLLSAQRQRQMPGFNVVRNFWQLLPSRVCLFSANSGRLGLKLHSESQTKARKQLVSGGGEKKGGRKVKRRPKSMSSWLKPLSLASSGQLKQTSDPSTRREGVGPEDVTLWTFHSPPGWNAKLQDASRRKESQKH